MADDASTLYCPRCYGTACRPAGPQDWVATAGGDAGEDIVCEECGAHFLLPPARWRMWVRGVAGVLLLAAGAVVVVASLPVTGRSVATLLIGGAVVAMGVVQVVAAVHQFNAAVEKRGFPVLPARHPLGVLPDPSHFARPAGSDAQPGGDVRRLPPPLPPRAVLRHPVEPPPPPG